MEKYDIVAVGGGIAGSIAAPLAAENRFSTLLIERAQTPRDKFCSGIQFGYFIKLVGRPIPEDKLCANEIVNMNIITPDGKKYQGKMKILNFWRSTFDRWLNDLAVEEGAIFQDKTRMIDYDLVDGGYQVQLLSGVDTREVFTYYLIAADGRSSKVRKKLQPDHYLQKSPGGCNELLLHRRRRSGSAWTLFGQSKSLCAEHDLKDCADRFYDYVCQTYNFKGEIVRKEGFASPLKNSVYLGEGNILLCGDAAGLLDAYRGVAMDSASLSARFVVQAILAAEKSGTTAISHYTRRMQPMKRQMEANEIKRQAKFASDESLAASYALQQVLKDGIKMIAANTANKFLPPEKVITLPF